MTPVPSPDLATTRDLFNRAKEALGGLDGMAAALDWNGQYLVTLSEADIELNSGRPLSPALRASLADVKSALEASLAQIDARTEAFDFFDQLLTNTSTTAPKSAPAPAAPPRPAPAVTRPASPARAPAAPRREPARPAFRPVTRKPRVPAVPETLVPSTIVLSQKDIELAYGMFLARHLGVVDEEHQIAPALAFMARSLDSFNLTSKKLIEGVDTISIKNSLRNIIKGKKVETLGKTAEAYQQFFTRHPAFQRWQQSGGPFAQFLDLSPDDLADIVIEALRCQQSALEDEIEVKASIRFAHLMGRADFSTTAREFAALDTEEGDEDADEEDVGSTGDAYLDLLIQRVIASAMRGEPVYYPKNQKLEERELSTLCQWFPEEFELLQGSVRAKRVGRIKGCVPWDKQIAALDVRNSVTFFHLVLGKKKTFPDLERLESRAGFLHPSRGGPFSGNVTVSTLLSSRVASIFERFPPGSQWFISPDAGTELTDGPVTIVDPNDVPNFDELFAETPALQQGGVFVEWNDGSARGLRRTILRAKALVSRERYDELAAKRRAAQLKTHQAKEARAEAAEQKRLARFLR